MTPTEYAQSHQKAFRTAFNFLKSHFPPVNTDEWWLKTAEDSGNISVMCEEDPLTIQLVSGVINYLNDECKKRGDNHDEPVDS